MNWDFLFWARQRFYGIFFLVARKEERERELLQMWTNHRKWNNKCVYDVRRFIDMYTTNKHTYAKEERKQEKKIHTNVTIWRITWRTMFQPNSTHLNIINFSKCSKVARTQNTHNLDITSIYICNNKYVVCMML